MESRWYLGYYRDGRERRDLAMAADSNAPPGRRPAATEEEAARVLRATVRAERLKLGKAKATGPQGLLRLGLWTGMRVGEIAKLTWAMFDRETRTLWLQASAAKTGKGRVLVLAGPLAAVIERRLQARRLDCPLILHRTAKGLPGQPVGRRVVGLAEGRN